MTETARVATKIRFHHYLIESLQDHDHAAAYIEAILEEEDPEATLLKSALHDVVEAFSKTTMSPEQAELQRQKLDEILSQPGSQAIYGLVNWLGEIGLRLSVAVQDHDNEHEGSSE